MRWSKLVVTLAVGGMITGCSLVFPFETLPEGDGGNGGSGNAGNTGGTGNTGNTGGATTTSSAGGATTTSTTSTGGTGGAMCTADCCSDADCPVPANPCRMGVCAGGQCDSVPINDGEDANVQIQGDCKRFVCQNGNIDTQHDPADVLDDGNDCTEDFCTGGNPESNTLNQSNTCKLPNDEVGYCNGKGKCVECMGNATCPDQTPICDNDPDNGVCIPTTCDNGILDGAETAKDCGGPDCAGCSSGFSCNVDSDCLTNLCDPLGFCAFSNCNDGVKNGNESDVDCGDSCPLSKECGPLKHCNKDSDCEGNQCTGEGGICVPNCNDGVQNNLETDDDCGGGICAACGIGEKCGGLDSNCISKQCGPDGTCIGEPDGTQCTANGQCNSGYCRDGVCCNTTCNGICKSCNLPGNVGTCTNVPAGQDPDGNCLNGCDGSGACL